MTGLFVITGCLVYLVISGFAASVIGEGDPDRDDRGMGLLWPLVLVFLVCMFAWDIGAELPNRRYRRAALEAEQKMAAAEAAKNRPAEIERLEKLNDIPPLVNVDEEFDEIEIIDASGEPQEPIRGTAQVIRQSFSVPPFVIGQNRYSCDLGPLCWCTGLLPKGHKEWAELSFSQVAAWHRARGNW